MTATQRRAGSLFSGGGWLDQAIEEVFGATTAWHCEWDPAASKVLARHWPGVPNHHDAATTDWANVEPVYVIGGGSPCQDVSLAGARGGMTEGTRSNLWVAMRDAIATIKPAIVVWENVAGSRSATAASAMESDPGLLGDHPTVKPALRALGRVLGDLASLGFDAEWRSLRAADVGACHGRERVFVLAWHPSRVNLQGHGSEGIEVSAASVGARVFGGTDRRNNGLNLLPTPVAQPSGNSPEAHLRKKPGRQVVTDLAVLVENGLLATGGKLLPTPRASEADHPGRKDTGHGGQIGLAEAANGMDGWGEYAAAIHRAELAHGHPAPPPTETSPKGNKRLSPRFAEWMMMSDPGHVTDTPGISRNDQLKICGNGVVRPRPWPPSETCSQRHGLTL